MQSQLLHNNWFGKAIGATCAWIWAPSDPQWLALWLIAGITAGHLYDIWARTFEDDDGATLARLAGRHMRSTSVHLEFLFAAMGRIAKTSGPVTPKHIAYAEQLMQQMMLTADTQAQAKEWFNEGKANSFPMQNLARKCLQPTEQGSASRLSILRCMCTMASIRADDQTLASLKQLGGYLGFAPPHIAREFGEVHKSAGSEHASSQSPNNKPVNQALTHAFKCLNVEPGASQARVKHAYRQLVSRYHPDKLPANAPEKDKQLAQARMVELRDALELIQAQQS